MSGHNINLQQFNETCTGQLNQSSPHKIKNDSASDMSTLDYLKRFRKEIGYKNPYQGLLDPGLSVASNESISSSGSETELQIEEAEVLESLSMSFLEELDNSDLGDSPSSTDFSNLKAIDISSSGIKRITNLGGKIPFVQKLNASRNQIDTFLEMTTPPIALKQVDFSFNQINKVVNLNQFWSLTDIDLSHNELTVVEGFSELEFLQTLNLSYNKIVKIANLDCPNLLILYLNCNLLEETFGLLNCNTLKFINFNGNKISSFTGLKNMVELTDLYVSHNNIESIFEFEHLEALISLTHIRVEFNPITSLDGWRLVLINMLPQLLWLDGQRLKFSEMRKAENIFNPSFRKMAFMDHATILIDRACQTANSIFDDYCRNRPFPPMILLVGPPRSHCHTLALLLKQKFRNKIYLGGVHSTATTMEGSNPNLDIPVSFESFKEMKNRGEFLATSQILGRVCGFATSQIATAAEKGALLVANVPLATAISLKEWNLLPKLVLVFSSTLPQFTQNEERIESIRRNSLNEAEEVRRKSDSENIEIFAEQNNHPVNFAETHKFDTPSPEFTQKEDKTEAISRYSQSEAEEVRKKSESEDIEMFQNKDQLVNFTETRKFSTSPEVTQNEDRTEAIIRYSQNEAEEVIRESEDIFIEQKKDHLVNFGETRKFGSTPPEFTQNEDKTEAIIRYSQNEGEEVRRKSKLEDIEMNKDHLVNFGETRKFGSTPPEFTQNEDKTEAIIRYSQNEAEELIRELEDIFVEQKKDHLVNFAENRKFDSTPPDRTEAIIRYSQNESEEVRRKSESEDIEIFAEQNNHPVNFAETHKFDHHRRHAEALISSILQTKEEYCSFHRDNPGFFHLVLDTSDLCRSYKTLEDFAMSCLNKHKTDSPVSMSKNSKKSMVKSHAGKNKMDEQNFVAERLQDFKTSTILWSKGNYILSNTLERKPNYKEKPSELLYEKSSCPPNLLDTSLPRPKITLKMKRVVELHEKKLRCSKKSF